MLILKIAKNIFRLATLIIFLSCFVPKIAFGDSTASRNNYRECDSDGKVSGFRALPLDFTSWNNKLNNTNEANNEANVDYAIDLDNTSCQVDAALVATAVVGASSGSYATAKTAILALIAKAAIQIPIAKDWYNNLSLCGANWMRNDPTNYLKDSLPDYKKDIKESIKNTCNNLSINCDSKKLSGVEKDTCTNCSMKSQEYREYFYDGVEKADTGEDACEDMRTDSPHRYNEVTNEVMEVMNEVMSALNPSSSIKTNYPTQRYYMRGNDQGNYACHRFNPNVIKSLEFSSSDARRRANSSYQCCLRKSKSSACIYNKFSDEHKFCSAGEKYCDVGGVLFNVEYQDYNRMVCVNTKSLCPFDFNVGGGSTKAVSYKDNHTEAYDRQITSKLGCNRDGLISEIRKDDCSFNLKAGKNKNYCQLYNHCTIIDSNADYVYETSIVSPYFSRACLDFVGDSRNGYEYDSGRIAGLQKHFTAPIAQCVRETLENIFTNKAGHSLCSNYKEYPNKNGICPTGNTNGYKYQKDNILPKESFFSSIQNSLKSAIRMALTISIMMQGLKILLTGSPLKSAEIVMYVVKIGLVLFFATGNAWQGFFFDGIYNVSATFSNVVMNITISNDDTLNDGCQFSKVSVDGFDQTPIAYPKGKEYIAIFDTIDCKIAMYLGYGPKANIAGITQLIFAGFLGPLGLFFTIVTIFFGIYVIAIALRVLHIFLTSGFAIILLVYISPITITSILFKKTEPIFNKWLANLIGFSLQPIILFAYLGFMLTILGTVMNGSATFVSDDNHNHSTKKIDCSDQAELDSVICIMNLDLDKSFYSTSPILAPLGVGIPILVDLAKVGLGLGSDYRARERLITLLKAAFVLYILASFLDEIPSIASKIMGGTMLPASDVPSAGEMAKSLHTAAYAVQSRAIKGGLKAVKAAAQIVKTIAPLVGGPKGELIGKFADGIKEGAEGLEKVNKKAEEVVNNNTNANKVNV
jgi:type IV secretory pathway VirB6-like protein